MNGLTRGDRVSGQYGRGGLDAFERLTAGDSVLGCPNIATEVSRPCHLQALERALGAARSLNVINLGLNLRRPGLVEFIDRHTALVAEWMSGLEPKTPLI
jgi:hypothetical protein